MLPSKPFANCRRRRRRGEKGFAAKWRVSIDATLSLSPPPPLPDVQGMFVVAAGGSAAFSGQRRLFDNFESL